MQEIEGFQYFQTPLRPSSDRRDLNSSVLISNLGPSSAVFSSSESGSLSDNPSDPKQLTEVQVSIAMV